MVRAAGWVVALFVAVAAGARPQTPSIIEPERDGQLVSGGDVHMVTAPFSDPAGGSHVCSDWEIRFEDAVVWEARCATAAARLHIHMGDGVFAGTHAGKRALTGGATFVLRARHRSDGQASDQWSEWASREFATAVPSPTQPLRIREVLATEGLQWSLVPPPGARAVLEAPDGARLAELRASGFLKDPPLGARSALRVSIEAGDEPWPAPPSEISFEDETGRERTVYLPALVMGPGERVAFWVSANGTTHPAAEVESRSPDFERTARGAPIPWSVRQPGFVVEHVAGGLQLPVSIAFVPDPGDEPDAPFFYVTELYGSVKVVTRDGQVHDFVTGLLNAVPNGAFPGAGESGIGGIAVHPASGDVYVTGVYWPHGAWLPAPRILRLRPREDGLRVASVEVVKAFPETIQSPSHQISNISIGPDEKLYVHVGDSANPETASDPKTILGKVLRMELDGSPSAGNPFFDASDGIDATDYIFASGFRNPFGGAWRAADLSLYSVENGPGTDRLARIVKGRDYGWDGTDSSMRNYALWMWQSPSAPVQIDFVQPETFDGSGFPQDRMGAAYVTESGATWASGVQERGKRITEILWQADNVQGTPRPLVEYDGSGKATAVGVAAGPDGLYFTDLYKDHAYQTPIDRGANVFRVRWVGYADFDTQPLGLDGLSIELRDRSQVPGATSWLWEFGDGGSSNERNPRYTYAREGTYLVRLSVSGATGIRRMTKRILVTGEAEPLTGEYFDNPDFAGSPVSRTDAVVDFHWTADTTPFLKAPLHGFSARWTGSLRPRFSEQYSFRLVAGGEARVWVGGILLIDTWQGSDPRSSDELDLEAGEEYPVTIEYRNRNTDSSFQLVWESSSQPRTSLPRSFLLPKGRAARR